MLLVSFLGKTY